MTELKKTLGALVALLSLLLFSPLALAASGSSNGASPGTVTCPTNSCGGIVTAANEYPSVGTHSYSVQVSAEGNDYEGDLVSYGYQWNYTVTANSSSSLTFDTFSLSNGWSTNNQAVWGPFYQSGPSGYNHNDPTNMCEPLTDNSGTNYTDYTVTGVSSSQQAQAEQIIFLGGSACSPVFSNGLLGEGAQDEVINFYPQ